MSVMRKLRGRRSRDQTHHVVFRSTPHAWLFSLELAREGGISLQKIVEGIGWIAVGEWSRLLAPDPDVSVVVEDEARAHDTGVESEFAHPPFIDKVVHRRAFVGKKRPPTPPCDSGISIAMMSASNS